MFRYLRRVAVSHIMVNWVESDVASLLLWLSVPLATCSCFSHYGNLGGIRCSFATIMAECSVGDVYFPKHVAA